MSQSTTYKIISYQEAVDWRRDVTLVTGVFDITHIGHLHLLEYAAGILRGCGESCPTRPVIVGINSDRAVKVLKGPTRPVNDEHTRARMLAALACVSRVFIIDDVKVAGALHDIRPEVWCKGGDYSLETLNSDERYVAQSLGIHITFAPLVPGVSTTKILGQQAHWEKP